MTHDLHSALHRVVDAVIAVFDALTTGTGLAEAWATFDRNVGIVNALRNQGDEK